MKLLITFLFTVPYSVMGQDILPINTRYTPPFVFNFEDLPEVKKYTPITLQDLLDYKRECWNDSAQKYMIVHKGGYANPFTKTCATIPCPCPSIKVWTHKEPSWDGFLEWMAKQKQ